MKIQLRDVSKNQNLSNAKVQLQTKGKEAGLLWVNTDAHGFFQLEEKYKGHQISVSSPTGASPWVQAEDGAVVNCKAEACAATTGFNNSANKPFGTSTSSTKQQYDDVTNKAKEKEETIK